MHDSALHAASELQFIWEIPDRVLEPLPVGSCSETPLHSADLIEQMAGLGSSLTLVADDFGRRDVLSAIEQAGACGMWVTCRFRPGSSIRGVDFDALRRAGVRDVSVPVDGAFAQTHDTRHGAPGSWNRMLQIATAARRARISVRIATTFDRALLREWWKLVKLVQQWQPESWDVGISIPATRDNDAPDAAQTETLLRALAASSLSMEIPVTTRHTPQWARVLMQACGGTHHHRLSPNPDRRTMFISRRGEIQPDEQLPIACGNVRTHRLLDVHQDSTVFRRIRAEAQLKGKCGRCEFRRVCGGSRARAYAVTGDYLAADPSCPYVPSTPRSRSRRPASR